MKAVRHALILEIIESEDVETQEELAEQLKRHNVKVTQATVSRDIKELRLLKVLARDGGYKYATAERAEQGTSDRFSRIFAESVVSIVASDHLIVIKTLPASANAAAEAIDGFKWPEVLGTLAGDNTILVIACADVDAEQLVTRFKALART
ncbi:MAG: arginine repressor [Clostridia bacterium]